MTLMRSEKTPGRQNRLTGIRKTFGGIAHQTGQHETTNPLWYNQSED